MTLFSLHIMSPAAKNTADLAFDRDLIERYDQAGPRYTSYPTAIEFHEGYGTADYEASARDSNSGCPPLSLYFHLPFCATVCFYCACNKIITKNRAHAEPYLERLHQEIQMQGRLFDKARRVEQLHWGGGTPTFLSDRQMEALMEQTARYFSVLSDDTGEYSIEIDPREATADTIMRLRGLGFNRLSLGVQDFDEKVQKAVNRIQSLQQTATVVDAARAAGFRSVNIDLIYGLPLQTVRSFERTLDTVLTHLGPDRVSVFNYAHLPARFKTQRQINAAELPPPEVKLSILQKTIESFAAAGYVYIGMDHFARPEDELAIAQQERRLHRNFQGYSTHADCDLVGLGITAIGRVADSYSQNLSNLAEYSARIDAGDLPIMRGILLDKDDKLRRSVIGELICHFELDLAGIERQYGIVFDDYFAREITMLKPLVDDGLIESEGRRLRVTATGRLLIRNICMVFDRYRQAVQDDGRFSRAI